MVDLTLLSWLWDNKYLVLGLFFGLVCGCVGLLVGVGVGWVLK